ncbi:MAG TPA: hypothetical protein VGM91_06900 [Conexibacter sp.]|jgi:hypothetical protein
MFSPRAPRIIGAALLEVAEAMLRPFDESDAGDDRACPSADRSHELDAHTGQLEFKWLDHPHRRPARVDHRRRPGAVAPQPAPCSVSLSTAPDRRAPRTLHSGSAAVSR